MQIVQLDFRSRRQPEIRVLHLEKIGGEFRQLSGTHQRRGVHQKWRKNFGVAVLARVHIEKKIRQRAFQPRSPAFVDRKSRTGDLRGGGQIENSGALADFPMRLRREIELRRRAPAADFDIVVRAVPHRHAGMRHVRNRQQKLALRRVELSDALVALLDALRNLLHLRDYCVGGLLFFFQRGDFVAGFVALRLELLGRGDQFAPLFVERAKCVQIERGAALFRHFGEHIQVLPEVIEVMHGQKRIAYSDAQSEAGSLRRMRMQFVRRRTGLQSC